YRDRAAERAGGGGGLGGGRLRHLGRRGRPRRQYRGRAARRQRERAHYGKRAPQGLHRHDLQDDDGGFHQGDGDAAGAARADDAAERDRHRRRRADQGRQRRGGRRRALRLARSRRAVRHGGHEQGERSAAVTR